MFDVDPEHFGPCRIEGPPVRGRFGPVYRAHDTELNRDVMVRVFDGFAPAEHAAVLGALESLCESPLDHPAIAQPVGSGTTGEYPYLVHLRLDGQSLDAFLAEHGPQPLPEVSRRLTQLAAAVDFAAAEGIYHGVLSPQDVIVGGEITGVTGLGLAQALVSAGVHVSGASPSREADVAALAAIAFELLTGEPYRGSLEPLRTVTGSDQMKLRSAFDAALGAGWDARPRTALDFARSLEDAARQTLLATPAGDVPDGSEDTPPEPARRGSVLEFESEEPPFVPSPPPAPPPSVSRPPAPSAFEASLRDVDRRFESDEPVFRSPMFAAAPMATAVPRRRAPAVAAGVLAGLAVGFAGGYLVGQRREALMVRDSTEVDARATSGSGAGDALSEPTRVREEALPVAPSQPQASPESARRDTTSSQPSTEAESPPPAPSPPPVPDPRAEPPVARTPLPDAARRAQPPVRTPAPVVAPATTGSLEIVSRPSGASVYLDGALAGRTPLTVSDVRAGNRAVRLDLTGHREWATTVAVRPGERTRVAASLEP